MLCKCGYVTSHCCKVNTMVFVTLLQVRKLNFLNRVANYDAFIIEICYLLKKIHFTHLQQYDKNHCIYLARIGHPSEKAGGKVPMHAQHRIINFCIIYTSS